jgi:hypothetical protein
LKESSLDLEVGVERSSRASTTPSPPAVAHRSRCCSLWLPSSPPLPEVDGDDAAEEQGLLPLLAYDNSPALAVRVVDNVKLVNVKIAPSNALDFSTPRRHHTASPANLRASLDVASIMAKDKARSNACRRSYRAIIITASSFFSFSKRKV